MWPLLVGLVAAQPIRSLLRPEDEQPLPWYCSDLQVVGDTVPYAVAAEARRSFARTYGAVSELENEVLPAMVRRPSRSNGVFRIGFNSMFNVTQLPTIACGELALQKFDVSAYNLAFAAGGERLTVFYSASGNSSIIWQNWADRTIKHGGTFIVGHFYAFTAPLWGDRVINADQLDDNLLTEDYAILASDDSLGGLSLDYVAGASLDLDVAYFGAGYVGSQGLYFHTDQPQTGLFFNTIADLRDGAQIDPLRYLKTGISGAAWIWGEREALGATDADLSRYRVVGPSGTIYTSEDGGETAEDAEETFTLTRIRQRNLRDGILDASLSYAIKPEPAFYEATVRLHTRSFHPDLVKKYAGRYGVDEEGAGGIALGLVSLPERTYMAVRGGVKPYLALDAVLYRDSYDVHRGNVRFQFLLNDPDTLAIFPYAQGAWKLHTSMSMSI
jgi:hypothetical protein